MNNEKIDFVVKKYSDAITETQKNDLRQQLETVSDEKFNAVNSLKIKSPYITVFLSLIFGLFGAGSFYLGYIKRGICKIIFNVIVPLSLGLVFLYWLAPLNASYSNQSYKLYNTISAVQNTIVNPASEYSTQYNEYSSFVDELDKTRLNVYVEPATDISDDIAENYTDTYNYLRLQFNDYINKFSELFADWSDADINLLLTEINAELANVEIIIKQETENEEAEDEEVENEEAVTVAAVNSLTDIKAAAEEIISKSEVFDTVLPEEESVRAVIADYNLNVNEIIKAKTFETIYLAVDKFTFPYISEANKTFERFINTVYGSDTENGIFNSIENLSEKYSSAISELQLLAAKLIDLNNNIHAGEQETELALSVKALKIYIDKIEECSKSLDDYFKIDLGGETEYGYNQFVIDFTANANNLKAVVECNDKYFNTENDSAIKHCLDKMLTLKDLITRTNIAVAVLMLDVKNYTLQETDIQFIDRKTLHEIFLTNEIEVKRHIYSDSDLKEGSEAKVLYGDTINNIIFSATVTNSELYKMIQKYFISVTDKAVDDRLQFNDALLNIIDKFSAIEDTDDILALKSVMQDTSQMVSDLQVRANKAYYDWKEISEIFNMLFTTYLCIDGVIILAYWIGEIFKDKQKCRNLNFKKISEAINQ